MISTPDGRRWRLLASGWSSEVFEHQPSERVIKVARAAVPGFEDEISRQALARAWARELAALQAVADVDAVPALLGSGITDGRPYIALQRAPGETLWDVRRRRRLSLSQVTGVLRHLADCLTALHQRGWLHLDLNPGNVMMAEDGAVTLLDFGATQRLDQADPWDWPLGRHRYMAHEHIAGRHETPAYGRLTVASDVHQLACLAMFMLTGREPFRPCRQEEEYRNEYLAALSAWSGQPAIVRVRHVLAEEVLYAGAVATLARALESDPVQRIQQPARFFSEWELALPKMQELGIPTTGILG